MASDASASYVARTSEAMALSQQYKRNFSYRDKHIEAEMKWTFRRRHFQTYFR